MAESRTLRDEEIEELKHICRKMTHEIKSPFDELVQDAIEILARAQERNENDR